MTLNRQEILDAIGVLLGDMEIVTSDINIEGGIRETTPSAVDCLANNLDMPSHKTFEHDGTLTITMVVRARKRYEESADHR